MEATDNIDDIAASLIVSDSDEATEAPEPDDLDQPEVAEQNDDTSDIGDEAEEPADTGEDDDTETDEGQLGRDLYIVKVDGREERVTLDDLKRSYSGQAYIQKGMQEAATAKKEAEAAYQQLLDGRNAIATLYQQLSSGQMVAAPTPPDPTRIRTDPVGYMEAHADYERKVQAYQQQQAQIQDAIGQQAAANDYQQRAYMAEQARELARAIPDFADASKAGELQSRLVETGAHYGYTADDIGGVMDHRALLVLHDAMKYRALQKVKPAEKAQAARPVVKPGAKPADAGKGQAEKARAQMKKTRSDADFAAYLMT